jgi:F0F1-type ATP synthase membrane subunit b/b'
MASSFADATMFAPEACEWLVSTFADAAGLVSADRPATVAVDMATHPGQPDGPGQEQAAVAGSHARVQAFPAGADALRGQAVAAAEQITAAARAEAAEIIRKAREQGDAIIDRAHLLLKESERRQAEITDRRASAEAEAKRLIQGATRQARQIVERARSAAAPAPPEGNAAIAPGEDGGAPRRFGRKEPEPKPVIRAVAPPRLKRTGKR